MQFRESKNWAEMNTTLSKKFEAKNIISTLPSVKHNLSDDYKISYQLHSDLIDFIAKNYIAESGNISLITKEFIQKIIENNNIFCTCNILSKNQLVTFCLSLIIPIRVEKIQRNMIKYSDTSLDDNHPNEKTVFFGYTNYLCVHKEERNHELGINAVKATLEYGFSKGVQFGYFLSSTPKTTASMNIKPWFRIINIANARKIGHKFEGIKEMELKAHLSNHISKNYTIKKSTTDDLKSYGKFVSSKKFAFVPSKNYWDLYLKIFETYTVLFFDGTVGMFSLLKTKIFLTSKNKIIDIYRVLWCVGSEEHMKSILKCICNVSENSKVDVLYGFILGDINKIDVEKIGGLFSPDMYLEFYNTNIKYELKDINIPIY